MIRLRQLVKENSYEQFSWLDPDGNFHVVPTEGHSAFAKEMLNKLRMPSSDVYGTMYDLGWVRVTMFGYMGQYGVHFNLRKGKRPTSIQKDALIDLAKRNGAYEIIDDTNGGVAYTDEFWE